MEKIVRYNELKPDMKIIGCGMFSDGPWSEWNHLVCDTNGTIIRDGAVKQDSFRIPEYQRQYYFKVLIKDKQMNYTKTEVLEVTKSSVLRKLAYNRSNQTLTTEFSNGSVYMYDDVLPCVFDTLVFAQENGLSVGHLFNELVKNV